MKVSLLLETIITSGLSMTATQHGGVIDSAAKLSRILAEAGTPETGHIQNKTTSQIKDDIRSAINSRDLSWLIDLVKEIAYYLPGELLQYSKDIKEILVELGYTVEPLYLERDFEQVLPGHPPQHLPIGQIIYRMRSVYVSITSSAKDTNTRLQAVDIFISMLICSPHLQRKVIGLCMTPEVQANHFDPLLPHARLLRLRTVLTKMAMDELYDLPSEDKTPEVPPLQLVEEEETDMSQYEAKPQPWLHFTGTDHLVAPKQEHGTLPEQVAVFKFIINSTTNGSVEERIRNATAYIHRSTYQEALTASLIGTEGVSTLNSLDDARLRANEVRKAIEHLVRSSVNLPSIYKHPGRKPATTPPIPEKGAMAQALEDATKIPSKGPVEQNVALQELLEHFGKIIIMEPALGKTLKDIKAGIDVKPADAVKALMSQLNFVNGAGSVMVDEPMARVQAALPELFNQDGTLNVYAVTQGAGKTPKPKAEPAPVEISGGDAQMRADIQALFESRGQKVKFTDEVPKITHSEVHVYQCQVGGAIVALQYTPNDKVCTLTAMADNATGRQMQPLCWQALEKDVPEIWSNIREALNYHDAYWRIERFLGESGYIQ